MIGTTLDKYEVLQKVGEGGMATVYRGRHTTLDRSVAIKVLHPHLSSSTRNRKRFAREARAIEQLRHENILEIFDYSGASAEDCYIVTEFVPGETLTEHLREVGRLPSEVAAIVGRALCDGLAYAHSMGVLHRDLKPDNVMVRVDGTIKLMDFGIARFLDESQVTMTGALVGSPAFMSPEQAREHDLDQRSDLFALGTLLFYLVTGHLPFAGSNPSLILKNVIEGNRPNVSELAPTMSARLADVIERLMATNPDDRFPTAEAAGDALGACLAEARIDPAIDAWSLHAWLEDPDPWEQRLEAHLSEVLLDEGRRCLEQGDHLAALRLFNRLLSMDEDNEEVLALVQGLHGDPSPRSRAGVYLGALAALLLFLGGAGGLVWVGQRYATPEEPPTAELPPPPAPVRAEVSPSPEPAPADVQVEAPAPAPQPRVRIIRKPAPAPAPAVAPVPVAEPNDVVPEEEQQPGWLTINSGELMGDVWLDGRKVGDTRQRHQVAPGAHALEIRGLFLQTHTEQITVSSGEELTLPVRLQPKPGHVVFDASYPDDCSVHLDGTASGTVGSLQRRLMVVDPDRPHEVVVDCGDAGRRSERFGVVPGEVTFPPI